MVRAASALPGHFSKPNMYNLQSLTYPSDCQIY